jgi:hypothetical protein
MEWIAVLYAVLPFVTSIVFKSFSYQRGGKTQKRAIKKLLDERTTPTGAPLLDDNQIDVAVTVAGYAVRSLTAASTLVASLIALVIVTLKYPHWFVRTCLAADIVLAIVVWIRVYRHRGSWEDIWGVPVGEYFLLMSFVIDAFGLAASITGPIVAGK